MPFFPLPRLYKNEKKEKRIRNVKTSHQQINSTDVPGEGGEQMDWWHGCE
jgi:hypothetical protein